MFTGVSLNRNLNGWNNEKNISLIIERIGHMIFSVVFTVALNFACPKSSITDD